MLLFFVRNIVFSTFLALVFVFSAHSPASGAENANTALNAQVASWLGAWEFTEPRSGTQFLILRSSGSASMFSSDDNSSEVLQGRWQFDGTRLEIDWPRRGRHVLERLDEGFRMSYVEAGADGYQFSVPASRMPSDHLGSWAVDPASERDQRQQEDEDRGFFGNWQVQPVGEAAYFILIRNDRSAATSLVAEGSSTSGRIGAWARQGTELHITWEDASYTVFTPIGDSFGVVHFQSGKPLDETQSKPVPARRIRRDAVDSDWLEAFNAERDALGWGIRFESQRHAQRFYRGNWLVDRGAFGIERISLGRMGGIRSTRRPSARGEWRLSTQDLFLNWEDGSRQIITPIGAGFVLFEYSAGRPVDAVPSRVFQTIPEDFDMLSAAQRQHKSDYSVFGDGSVSVPKESRWFSVLWPFGGESRSDFPEDTFVQGDQRSANNPWWWPFWSENEATAGQDESDNNGAMDGDAVPVEPLPEESLSPNSFDGKTQSRIKNSGWLPIP